MAEGEDTLLQAVHTLSGKVGTLTTELKNYPQRAEVARHYVSKEEQRKRIKKWIIGILIGLVISGLISVGVTIVTVSTCFLSNDARAGHAPDICNAVPGYADAQEENEKILKDFQKLLKQPAINARKLAELEKRVQELENAR